MSSRKRVKMKFGITTSRPHTNLKLEEDSKKGLQQCWSEQDWMKWWEEAMECCCYFTQHSKFFSADEKTLCERRFETPFRGPNNSV